MVRGMCGRELELTLSAESMTFTVVYGFARQTCEKTGKQAWGERKKKKAGE